MKRISAMICLTVIMVLSMVQVSFAAGFAVEKTSPADGEKGIPMENFGVKVFFNEEVYNKDNNKINKKACKLYDDKGKEVPSVVLFDKKYKNVALVLADTNNKNLRIKPTTEYSLKIDESFVSAKGEALGNPYETSFTTLNPSDSMKISMVMMIVMMGGMIFFTTKAAKKQMEEDMNNVKHHEEKFNPYKAAKESGKSVEEVLAEEAKRKEKEARKAKHKKEVEEESDNYRVKGPRPASKAGSKYVAHLKEEKIRIREEKRAAKAAKKHPQKKKSQNPHKR